jgi:four helix bundle protein
MEDKTKINSIQDLKAWQKAMELCFFVYPLTKNKTFESDFDLRRQIRKSCTSPASNIAEGYGRRGNKELVNFLSIALGSLSELETQLRIALEFGFISNVEFQKASGLISDCSKLSGALINYLNKSEFTGTKFKEHKLKESEVSYGFDVNFLIDDNQ